jgi:flagellar protein FlgJ
MGDNMLMPELRRPEATRVSPSQQLKSIADATRGSRNREALAKACQKMEALFIHHLMQEMRATVDKSGLVDGGPGETIFTSMLDAQMSTDLSAAGGLGLAKILFEQLSQPLEADPADPVTPDDTGDSPQHPGPVARNGEERPRGQ